MSTYKNIDPNLETAAGKISTRTTEIVQGINSDLDKADNSKVVWDYQTANRTYMTAGETLDISSSSGNDTGGGTGMTEITIVGLDTNGDLLTEVVPYAATWRTSGTFYEFIYAYASDAGTSLVNEGTVEIYGTGSGTRFGYIPANAGKTQQAYYPVKDGYSSYIQHIYSVVELATTIVVFKLMLFDGTTKRELRRWTVDTSIQRDREIDISLSPYKIPGGSTWWIEADTDTDNTPVRVEVTHKIIPD